MKKTLQISLLLILQVCMLTASVTVFELPFNQSIKQASMYLPLQSALEVRNSCNPPTKVAVTADSQALHISFRASTPTPPVIPKSPSSFDWEGEHIEIFLAPEQGSPKYFHWAVDLAGQMVSNIGMGNAQDHHFPWSKTIEITPDNYRIDVTIPLTSIGLKKGLIPGQTLDMNLCRVANSNADHYQSLVPLGGSFHQRNLFPTWVIGTFQDGAMLAMQEKLSQPDAQLQQSAERVFNETSYLNFLTCLNNIARSRLLTSVKDKHLVFWQADPCNPPRTTFLPNPDILRTAFRLQALHGERITLALAICNVSDTHLRFRVEPSNCMSDGANDIKTEKNCLIQRLVETRLRTGGTQRDALVELDIHDIADCLPGENEIIYLTIDTAPLTPGHWKLAIAIEPTLEVSFRKSIPISLEIKKTRLPQEGAPYSLNFPWYDYMKVSGYGHSPDYQEAVLRNQRRYGTNFHLIGPRDANVLAIKADANGNPTWKISFRELDRQIKVFGVRNQRFLISTSYRSLGCEPGKFHHEELNATFAQAMNAFKQELHKRHIRENQIAWYVTDEPNLATAKLTLPAAKLLRKHAPKQMTFCTFYPEMGLAPLKILNPAISLWCPSFAATPQQLKTVGGKPKIFYAVSNRTFSPYNAYRLYLWRALQRGASGAAFWSYDDVGHGQNASMWNDSDGNRSDYGVIYEGSRNPQGSVRQLAWFRGIQDWRILELARHKPHLKTAVTQAIQQVLSSSTPIADDVIDHFRNRLN